jgi:HlyD family secretion protein
MNDSSGQHDRDGRAMNEILDAAPAGRWRNGKLWLALLLAAAIVAAWAYTRSGKDATAPRYRTEPVSVGTLVVTVSATGKLQPTNQVEVGSELSGIVEQVFVDENDHVRKGQVLARLDVSKLEDTVARSRANLAAAEAQVKQTQATVAETTANLSRYRRMFESSGGELPSRSEMDTAEANVKRADANEASARAAVTQARANLRSDETNLDKASLRSPIDGIVLSRKIEPGQTVAASFQAPVLFTLAEDLRKMQLQVDVDEADVGKVAVGQPATFGVDAWPGRTYRAVITRVSYGSQEKDGVVSYQALLEVANDDLSLRPGMTGTAEITTLVHDDAVLVPNAALRFTPAVDAADAKPQSRGVMGALIPRPPSQPKKVKSTASATPRVWVLKDGVPVAVDVKTGATDGKVTEIVDGSLSAGTEVITESIGRTP